MRHNIAKCATVAGILTLATISALLCNSGYKAEAMPARPGYHTYLQPDGSTINAELRGDENFHYYVSDEGYVLTRNGDSFAYAELDNQNQFKKSSTPIRASQLKGTAPSKKISGLVSGTTFPSAGVQKAVVVLVEYQDVKFNLSNPLDYFTRMLNEEGFSDYWATGSARDFFIQCSDSIFLPEFDVYGPITLQKSREYYGGNDAYGNDNAPQKMVIEACRQLNATVDFSQYDRDNDGYIDNVFVFYAGRGEASGGSSDCVWPHAWTLTSAEPGSNYSFDGVRLNRYACSNEWELSDAGHGYRPVGVGTFIHEFSHVMGLPDLYSTSYADGTFTPGAWSALDYGPYNNDGCTPPQYSLFERASLGFVTPPQLTGQRNIRLDKIATNDGYYIPTSSDDEYFLIENRQQEGWDAYIPGHGMLVWHIDYDADIWSSNIVNNDPTHNYVDIIEADNTQTSDSRAGDAFPGTANVTSLGFSTVPALKSWSNRSTGVELTDITERNGRILLRLNGGSADIAATTCNPAESILAGGFTASWSAVDDAVGYTLSVYTKDDNGDSVFVNGYDSLYLSSDTTSYKVTGLEPSTQYFYNVVVDDGCYGSQESNEIEVQTLDPTFDYFAPTPLEASDITAHSFTARWEPMTDATAYFLSVYSQHEGDPETDIVDFTNGTDNMPEGWTSTSHDSYGMSSYAGNATPSLRMSADGQYLESPLYDKDIVSLEFWHRGNGTTANESIDILGLVNEQWQVLDTYPIVTTKGGQTISITEFPENTRQLRIQFNRQQNGSLAIDDITVEWGIPILDDAVEGYQSLEVGNVTEYSVTDLTPATSYSYSVKATNGELTSLASPFIYVMTDEASSGIANTAADATGFTINGRHITATGRFSIFDIYGRIVARNVTTCDIATAGVYLLVSDQSHDKSTYHKLLIQ
jgi:M6 family metalloprotease-like protein